MQSMFSLSCLLGIFAFALGSHAKTVKYDFNVTWVTANPDGLADRKVIGINGQWPLPVIEVDKGDRLIVNMYNDLDRASSIHWHGMFQNGTNEMDGASMVTQCPVPPGSTITYDFTVNQTGTYWYHCHTEYCYPDGYRQALIVHDKDAFFKDDYDEELVFTMSDWYHEMQDKLSAEFMSLYNPTGAEPIPGSFLLNDALETSFSVKPNTTYLIRLVNYGAFVGQYFWIEGHNFTIVEVDGVYTEPVETNMVYLSVAQRYAILLKTKNETDTNYPIVTVADATLLDLIPSDLKLNNTNWLEYNKDADHPEGKIDVAESTELVPHDDLTLVPHDGEKLFGEPDQTIELTVTMNNLMTGFNYAFFNNYTFTPPKVPSLLTAMSAGDDVDKKEIYGEYTHPMILEHNQVVEIIVNNDDGGAHPFHLHGHNFQIIDRVPTYGADFYSLEDEADRAIYDPDNHAEFPSKPIRRDTVVVPPLGYVVIRFVADNPGVWLFHCHIDWHLQSGLAMILIEAPDLIAERNSIPKNHYDICKAGETPYQGNAAANAEDLFDLKGQNKQPNFIPSGFTARGYVALVFSVISAVVGIIFIVIYGLSEDKYAQKEGASDSLNDAEAERDTVLVGSKNETVVATGQASNEH